MLQARLAARSDLERRLGSDDSQIRVCERLDGDPDLEEFIVEEPVVITELCISLAVAGRHLDEHAYRWTGGRNRGHYDVRKVLEDGVLDEILHLLVLFDGGKAWDSGSCRVPHLRGRDAAMNYRSAPLKRVGFGRIVGPRTLVRGGTFAAKR